MITAPSAARRRVSTWAVATVTGACVAWTGCISSPSLSTANEPAADGGDDLSDAGAALEAAPAEDAPPDDAAHAACVAACPAGGTCEGGTCVLACPGIAGCMLGVTCPPGIPCRVSCTGPRSCGTVDCGTASSCRVDCNGDTACGKIRGAAAQTDIVCTGKSACRDTRCDGDTCTVQCAGDACKPADVACCAATSCTVNGAPGKCN